MKRQIFCLFLLGTLCTPYTLAKDNARNMFVEQANKPQAQLNTGISYWLELERKEKKTRVSNKQAFQSGDRLRIHVKPNVDGYAYILMLHGSNGGKQVLFPSEGFTENKIKAGKDIVLPVGANSADAWLKFDDQPGTEVLRVLVSRKPLDAKQELEGDNPPSSGVMVASGNGQPDKIPQGALVCIVLPPNSKIPTATRNLTIESGKNNPHEQGQVTVVNTDPTKPLSVDIALDHQKGE